MSGASTAQGFIERAERCMDTFELPLALKFYERALKLEPDNTAVLDATGELLMQLGDLERAISVLERSVELVPDGNFANYMHLGQMTHGQSSVRSFDKGLELLRARASALRKRSKKAPSGSQAREELSAVEHHMCAALSAIAEIYLSDLCDEPDAEALCEKAVQEALAIGGDGRPPYVEALQASASLRISQGQPQQAEAALVQVVEQIGLAVERGELEQLPTHEFRITTAKLLLEVERADCACEVLEQLLLEDEDSPELRFLSALAAARSEELEQAETHLGWFDRQLQKPDCDEAMRKWSPSFEQARSELAVAAAKQPADGEAEAEEEAEGMDTG